MSAVKVNFEIGHEASLRSKKTPEGFTHDWEVFVRGQEGADISHFVDKVVFHLHETFKKPKRVVKEPPFSIKESGYAGFIFPIEIYLKNKDEPKKIKFTYDFTLQQSGFLKDRYIFPNPNEDFKKKLLKGGGLITNNSYYTNPDQENQRSRDSFSEEKQQLLSKPKLSSENVKKHKAKEHKDETPHKTSSFENLFGPPIQKPPKISPDPKKLDKVAPPPPPAKSDKKEKERSSSDKKSKHDHKEFKPDKVRIKIEKEKVKQEKVKNHNKEQEKSKDKASKRANERPPSPDVIKKSRISPRRLLSPPPRSSSASSMKEEYKVQKHTEPDPRKPKPEEKPPEHKPDKEQKEKKKKEKKSHDRDRDRKERKELKKENHKSKESPVSKDLAKEIHKARDTPKEKEPAKETTPVKEKQPKPEKATNKFSLENLQKTPPAEIDERSNHHKNRDKSDSERKHKHKKKDKKRDESKDKHKESNREKKHKHEKVREMPVEKREVIEHRETPVPKEPPPQEIDSPISIDTASQCSSKSGLAKTSHIIDDINSSHSDSESSMIADDDDKSKLNNTSPEPVKEPSPEPEPDPEPEVEPELEPLAEVLQQQQLKEKSKKHKEKSSKREEKREEKRRKRKAAEDEVVERQVAVAEHKTAVVAENKTALVAEHKTAVVAEPGPAPAFSEIERGESSGSVTTETKVQDNGVSSSLGEDAEPGDISPDYMVQLRDLQQRIMKIKNNEDLERVVNLIAETGRYEVTTQTFDFDLCLLDRSTVQQLIQLVGC